MTRKQTTDTAPDIVRWAQSRVGFYVDRRWLGHWVLAGRPIQLAGYHADILRHLFTSGANGRLPYDAVAWAEPAKSGKSAIAGLVAQYMAFHGEQGSQVVMASNKQNQAASVMYSSFAESVRMNPALHIEPGKYETTLPNGNVVKAIASNSRGEAGARFALALFDELWGYQYEDAERLWAEFKTDPTRLNSVRLAIGYAGYLESKLWLEVLEAGKGEPVPDLAHIQDADGGPTCWRNGRSFTFWSHTCRQPWQTEEWRAELRRTLRPTEFRRMVQCEFVEGLGNFCDPDVWAALIDPDHRPLEAGTDVPVYVGLDLALAPAGDDCALIGVYPDGDGRARVAFHRVWKGADRRSALRLKDTVLPYLLAAKRNYHVAGLYFDPWQAQHLADELRDNGLNAIPIAQTHASRGPRDTRLYEAVVQHQLVLYDDPDLRHAAAGASVKELGNGLIFLQKAGGRAKIDLLVALSNCATEALRGRVETHLGEQPWMASRFVGVFDSDRRSEYGSRWKRF